MFPSNSWEYLLFTKVLRKVFWQQLIRVCNCYGVVLKVREGSVATPTLIIVTCPTENLSWLVTWQIVRWTRGKTLDSYRDLTESWEDSVATVMEKWWLVWVMLRESPVNWSVQIFWPKWTSDTSASLASNPHEGSDFFWKRWCGGESERSRINTKLQSYFT